MCTVAICAVKKARGFDFRPGFHSEVIGTRHTIFLTT
jgi:hypothetical protein